MILLFLIFVCLPLAEIWVLVQVGQTIGALNTIAMLLVMGAFGAWLVKREGRKTFFDLQSTLQKGEMPTNELIHGFLILLGGLFMVTPGFITDLFGVLLVLPPSRHLALRATKYFIFRRVVFKTSVFHHESHQDFHSHNIKDVGPNAPRERGPGQSSNQELM